MRPGFPERGSFGDRFSEIERRLQALESANRLTSASIGSGGLTVKDGGDITVDGGDFLVTTAGGTFALTPLSILSDFDSDIAFSITTSETTINEVILTIPAWVSEVTLLTSATLIASGPGGSNRIVGNSIINDVGGLDDRGDNTYDLENNGLRYSNTNLLNTTVSNPGSSITCRQTSQENTTQGANGDRATFQVVALLT